MWKNSQNYNSHNVRQYTELRQQLDNGDTAGVREDWPIVKRIHQSAING